MFKTLKAAAVSAKTKAKALVISAGTGLAAYGNNAMAQSIPDVTDSVTFIEGLLVPIGLLGAAFLIVSIAIKGWKIMRSV